MTFAEMRDCYDKYDAFNRYLSVKDAKHLEYIPKDFQSYIPDYCECGSENIITTDLTSVCCCNPKCKIKQAFGLANLFAKFSCKGVGEALCKKAYNCVYSLNKRKIDSGEEPLLQSNSYVELLLLDSDIYPFDFVNSADGNCFLEYVKEIRSCEMTFPEMISKLGLPELDTTAFKLFNKINSFAELRETIIGEGGIQPFCINRGCYDPQKSFWLNVSLEDIYVACCVFTNIRSVGVSTQDICITGSLYPFGNRFTKKAFVDLCNKISCAPSIEGLVVELLKDRGEAWFVSNKEAIKSYLDEKSISYSGDTFMDISSSIEKNVTAGPQLLEIRLTQAKVSAPYIIADSPSNSAKYLEGVRRGIEQNSDGSERKVLVSSEEYISIIKEMVEKWKKKQQDIILNQIEKQKTRAMNLF